MDDFAMIYRMLSTLRRQMDDDRPDADAIRADVYHVSQNRLDNLWAMLAADGYVTGVTVTHYDDERQVLVTGPRITLKGLEYLADNTLMRRAQRAARGTKDATPFL